MIEIVKGESAKPALASILVEAIKGMDGDGCLYIGYPLVCTDSETFALDALLISKSYGLWTFSLIEELDEDITALHSEMDGTCLPLISSFNEHKELCVKRQLSFQVTPIAFASANVEIGDLSNEDYPICNRSTVVSYIKEHGIELSDTIYAKVLSVVQSVSSVRKGLHQRIVKRAGSRGDRLQNLENEIATLDHEQNCAVVETVRGIQRIRGLAGSGKTIILALKAAYLHAVHPDWKIVVTFHTRSLKEQFAYLIKKFVYHKTKTEPNWNNLLIMNAWGSSGGNRFSGVYYDFCLHNGIQCLDYNSAKLKFSSLEPFGAMCADALSAVESPVREYDAFLIDEAQDLTSSFLRMCFSSLKKGGLLVYAYDELQNLNANSLPSPEEIFVDKLGRPVEEVRNLIAGGEWDVILKKCYRNSRPVLATAHALGFGVYREPTHPERGDIGLVQMFDSNDLWTDVGYKSGGERIRDGEEVDLWRSNESSPKWLEDYLGDDEAISFKTFSTKEEQDKWMAEQIRLNLSEDELRAEDILVINPNPLTTRENVGPVRAALADYGIATHLVGVDTPSDVFFNPGSQSVAFSGVFRAKGNEAGMVYVINAQDCFGQSGNALSTWRNRLFTAITRSRAWVRVVGYGPSMQGLEDEFKKIKDNDFHLRFRYPTQEQRKFINIVNRDMTTRERQRLKDQNDSLGQIVKDIQDGKAFKEDFDAEMLAALKSWLQGAE